MLRLRVMDLLESRGWTRYRLAKEAGLSLNQAYRVARSDGWFSRLDRVTLERLCAALAVEPGELFERTPQKKRRK